MNKHVFCTDLCLARGEPLAGTGDAPGRVLMLAWPRGKWRNPRWQSVDMSGPLGQALHEAMEAGIHVALVDKVEAPAALPMLHAMPENVQTDFDDEASLIAAIRDYVRGDVFVGRPDARTTILCCTDSRRDACCARNGFSTYKALVAIADPGRFNIVQATHIGGCRFAASLMVLPQRQRYGRMTAGLVPAFLAALERGEIYLPAFKGRTDQPEPLQVAEIAALNWAYAAGRPTQQVTLHGDVPHAAPAGTAVTIEAHLPQARLMIGLRAEDFLVQGNCRIVANEGGKTELRWLVESVEVANRF